jgi:hypothetical protein
LRKPGLDSWKPGLKIEKTRIQNKDSEREWKCLLQRFNNS